MVNYVSGWISYDAQILSLGLKNTYFKCIMSICSKNCDSKLVEICITDEQFSNRIDQQDATV